MKDNSSKNTDLYRWREHLLDANFKLTEIHDCCELGAEATRFYVVVGSGTTQTVEKFKQAANLEK